MDGETGTGRGKVTMPQDGENPNCQFIPRGAQRGKLALPTPVTLLGLGTLLVAVGCHAPTKYSVLVRLVYGCGWEALES